MADRFPLILNTSANQIQEIASGDQLDLSGNNIANAGVITATTFSGSIAGASNGILGIITAAAADIDDFVEVGSNIQLGNAGVVTATTFKGNGDFVELDVDGHTNLDNVSIAGAVTATTFSGSGASLTGITNANISNSAAIDLSKLATGSLPSAITVASANLVDGTIVNADINASAAIAGTKISPNFGAQNILTTGQLQISGALPTILLNDENNENDFELRNQNGSFIIRDIDNPQTRYTIASSGMIHTFHGAASFSSNLDVGAGIDVTGNVIASGNVSGVNGIFSGNVSVGGTLTYEDVTNIDSVGIVTARAGLKVLAGGANVVGVVTATGGVFVPDNNQIQLGNAAGSADLKIYHDTSDSIIHQDGTGDLRIRSDNSIEFNTNGTQNAIWCDSGAAVKLYYNNGLKFKTTDTGIDVTGQVVADSASFTDDGSSSPTVKIFTDDANPYALNIGNSSYNASSPFGLNFFNNNSGEGYFRHIGNGAYKDYHFSLHDNSNNKLCIKFEGDDQSVELYGRGTKDLETTGTGVVVTGVCTATSFSGDGSGLSNVGISTEQVTPSSNVATLNLAKDDHKIVASGTYTIDVSGGTEAESHTLRIENSGTANVGFSTYFKFPSGGTPSLPTASGAISLISFSVHKVGSVGIATVLLSGASVNYI